LCSWLDVIARNTVADLARVRSRRNEIELHDDEPSTDDVEFDAEQKDLLERTFDAIRELPESLRVPLLMSAIEGASADDIAQQLGITAANARQRVSRARRALTDIRRNDR
jgi:RNA polymerase sigma-70 factor (ECF subfamily)